MSYDLIVFEPTAAPREPDAFLAWYRVQMTRCEPHRYGDPTLTSPRLAAWFEEMTRTYPPMNGPLASENLDDPKVTDYSVRTQVIYAAFRWSQARNAYDEVRRAAAVHRVGFFDVSGDAEIIFPKS
ncbi:MAG: hypothetical protein ACREEB_16905 [Caulobacteraceae bacterium]